MSDIARLIRRYFDEDQQVKAWFAVNTALNEDPESPELLYLAGAILREQGHIGMALPLLAKALSYEQRQSSLWMHYAATLHDLNEWDDAIKAFMVVHTMLPKDAMPPANIAATMTQKGKWNEALNWVAKAIALDPENYIAHISGSFACLALGRWKEGWDHSKWLHSHHLVTRIYNDKENEEPSWDGEPMKTVVVQCDQGIGDIIMYAQCIPQLEAACDTVIMECADRLVSLIKRTFPNVHVFGTLKDEGQSWSHQFKIDAHVHISALPRFFRQKDSEFPRKAYLTPDPEIVEKWKEWLSDKPRPWIGLSWQGGIQNTQKHLRTLALADLAPVMEQEGTFIDLSYKDNSKEVGIWNAKGLAQVIIPPIDQEDYEDTLALVSVLDEVVTVTTALVHACGALGRTARVLVPEVPMWRYAHRCGDGMIWYPEGSVHMYRKAHGETWASTIKRLSNDMKPRLQLVA